MNNLKKISISLSNVVESYTNKETGITDITLEVESRDLTSTENHMLNVLFPNTYLGIERLLTIEQLIKVIQ